MQEFIDVASAIATGAEKNIAKGRVEGRVEGRIEGQSLFLKKLLERRFGALPRWATEKLTRATEHELEAWAEAILTAQTLELLLNTDATH